METNIEMTNPALTYRAGVWEQDSGLVVWSRHKTFAAAKKAAVKYARDQKSATGGALSWSGGVRDPGGVTTWFDRHGDISLVETTEAAGDRQEV